MAKRLHRSTPATENHVIHGWEVANSTARLAIVPSSSDLGRVARQTDDGSVWVLVSISPVSWRRVDQSDELAAQPLKTVAMRMTHQPIPVPGALQALSGGMFCILRNRTRLNDLSWEYIQPSNYAAAFLGDYVQMLGAYPGYFDAAKCREIADHWALSYNSGTHDVARSQDLAGLFTYTSGIRDLSNAVNWALTIAFAIERGDTTIWAAHGATVLDCLDHLPRTAEGLIGANGTDYIGFPFHDPFKINGGGAAISAYTAYAYQRLAVLADASLQAQANGIIAGLRTLRRTDGYYNFTAGNQIPDAIATALVAAYGLGTEAECIKSGVAIADDYRDGKLSQWGGCRFTPVGNDFSAVLITPGSLAVGDRQNGGYWTVFAHWYAFAMQTAGREGEARALMTDIVEFFNRGQTSLTPTDNSMPVEAFNYEGPYIAYNQYPAAAGCFAALAVPAGPASDVVLELSGSASAAKTVPVPFHSTSDVEIFNPASSTVTVAVSSAGRFFTSDNSWTEREHGSFLTEKEMARIALASETFRRNRIGLKPAYPYGGYLKAAITSGTTTQPITIRLKQNAARKPKFLLPAQTWTDAFSAASLDSRYLVGERINWNLNAGALRCAKVYNDEYLLAPMAFEDGTIAATIMSIWTGHTPGVLLRWKDRSNFIWATIAVGSGNCYVFQMLNGVQSTLGSFAAGATANVPLAISASVVGTNVTCSCGSGSGGPWVTGVTGKGLAGVRCESTIQGSLNVATFDGLTITPQATAQRDWITDSELIFTRTGTWSKAGATMLTTDTLAFKCAIHPDFTGIQQMGATATFNSANWAAQNAGLGVRAASSTNMVYAVLDGTTLKVYDRNGTDTLLGSFTLGTPLTNGVDVTMTLRILNSYAICVKVGSEYFYPTPGGRAVNGSPCLVAKTGSSSSAQVTFKSMRCENYTANALQPVPVGYSLTAGPKRWQAWTTDLVHAGNLGSLVELRDHLGYLVDSVANGDDVQIFY